MFKVKTTNEEILMVFILKTQDTKQMLISENKHQLDTVEDIKIRILLHYFVLLLIVASVLLLRSP